MATKRTLVLDNGKMRRLRDGETVDPASFLVAGNFAELAGNEDAKTAAQKNLGLEELDPLAFYIIAKS